ncbi:molybdenum cofactor biosynthesis protein [Paenibacillus arenosi]|uniref:Molybdenum cofactor biosynthesis protein MoaE n=1 Tax=Paenibacillus arenosi TaxID=2774142 RepID=A0ABR9AYC0_9BACL|nr:molybdenum cofactor biosynthesis protein MoaE [Paenibacillus arenosi]MBD8498634.1 molybdenum cofactor biosynthesis protein MoaE [Paenibacillus arenosi]
MNYRIQCFASIAERIGRAELLLPSDSDTIRVIELKQTLAAQYPEAAELIMRSFVAANQQYAPDDSIVTPEDELAIIPPVSGGQGNAQPEEDVSQANHNDVSSTNGRFRLTRQSIDAQAVERQVSHPNHGATITFSGTTREITGNQQTLTLEYDAYIPMALQVMEQIGDEVETRWPGTLTAITHRLGTVGIGEASVVISVSAPHRASCYEASRYAIDRLKQIVPIWKKEVMSDGSFWVDQPNWNPIARNHADNANHTDHADLHKQD